MSTAFSPSVSVSCGSYGNCTFSLPSLATWTARTWALLHPRQVQIYEDEEIIRLFAVLRNQSRLHFLLMLNCGMLARDISDLRQDQVDWKKGLITRKRSKTQDHADVPVVRYKLWGQTWKELKKWRSDDPEIALLTHTGKRWIEDHQEPRTGSTEVTRCGLPSVSISLKPGSRNRRRMLRATGASKLAEHPQYKYFSQYYLGHSPRTVAEKHYVRPTDKEFFEALAWLERALGLNSFFLCPEHSRAVFSCPDSPSEGTKRRTLPRRLSRHTLGQK